MGSADSDGKPGQSRVNTCLQGEDQKKKSCLAVMKEKLKRSSSTAVISTSKGTVQRQPTVFCRGIRGHHVPGFLAVKSLLVFIPSRVVFVNFLSARNHPPSRID